MSTEHKCDYSSKNNGRICSVFTNSPLIYAMSLLRISIIDIAATLEVPVSEAIKLIDGEIDSAQAEKIRRRWFPGWKLDELFKNE